MIMVTASELSRAQLRQVKHYSAQWSPEELDMVAQRIVDAYCEFDGDWNEPRASYELDKYFPRGNRLEAWIAEFRSAGT
jgi:hypothetical protein